MTKEVEFKNGSKMFFDDEDSENIELDVGGSVNVNTGEMLGFTFGNEPQEFYTSPQTHQALREELERGHLEEYSIGHPNCRCTFYEGEKPVSEEEEELTEDMIDRPP